MEFLNPTTATFVAAGAGAGAYYVYANVIEPQNQAQRVLQAEQAQEELLRLEEEKLSKRGSNKQAKKKIVVLRPKKGDGSSEKDDSDAPKDVDERISVSNPFDPLNGNNISADATRNTKKESKKSGSKRNSVSISSDEIAALTVSTSVSAVVTTSSRLRQESLPSPSSAKSEKSVNFDSAHTTPKTELKIEEFKPVSKKEKKASKKTAAVSETPILVTTTSTKVALQKVNASPREIAEDREPLTMAAMHTPAMQHRNQPLSNSLNVSTGIPPLHSNEQDDFQTVKSPSREYRLAKQLSQAAAAAAVAEAAALAREKPQRKTSIKVVSPPGPLKEEVKVAEVMEKPAGPSAQEWAALQAMVKAKELALIASETRQSHFQRKIQELEKQIEADAQVVKAAKKTESRAQRFDEKIQSLNYTNTLLVSQISTEKETTKDVLLQLKRAQREHEVAVKEAVVAASAAAAVAAMAGHVCVAKGIEEDRSSELVEMETRIQELEHHRDHLVVQNNDLQLQLRQLRSQSETQREQDDSLREREEERTRLLAQVQFQLHEGQALLAKKEARIELLEAEMAELEGELESAKLEVEQYATRVGQAEETARSLGQAYEGEKHSLMEEMDLLRTQSVQEVAQATEKESSVKAQLQQQLDIVQAELSKTLENYQVLSAKHEEQVAAMSAELSHQNGTGRVELAVKTLELQKVQEELRSVRGEAQVLTEQLREAQALHAQQLSARQAEMDHLMQELKESNSQITTMTEQQAETKAQVAELQARTSEFSDMAQAQSERLLLRLADMEKSLAATIEREESLVVEKETLNVKLTDLSTRHETCEAMQARLTQEKTEISEAKVSEYEMLSKEKEQLTVEISQHKETIAQLEQHKTSLVSEREVLSLELKETIEAKKAAHEKLTEMEEMKQEYAAMTAHVLELETKLSASHVEQVVKTNEVTAEELFTTKEQVKVQVEEHDDVVEEIVETVSVSVPVEH
ncbi:hypothetical protein BGZ83_002180 [Gryganskiella cystojenkinii]|nr:hypothetical protein BGZ83_002180 [Gryganskiella cystojenkinii]